MNCLHSWNKDCRLLNILLKWHGAMHHHLVSVCRMFTLKEEREFIAAQYAHFHKVKTGEPVALFAARMHLLEISLILGEPALPEITRKYYATVSRRNIITVTEGKIKND